MKTLAISLLVLAGIFAAMLPDARAYTQPASVVDSGGGVSSSAGYENLGSIGQPVVGLSTGAAGSNHAGFIPVLGANGALWPVIAFDPATFTFTFFLGDPAPAGQNLAISNSGASTLEWLVSRNETWLSLVPLNGTGSPNPCLNLFHSGAPLVLTAYPNDDTLFTSWSGACGGNGTCSVTMSADRAVTATFSYVKPAWIEGTTSYHDTLQAAYNAALAGQTIRARQYTFVENLTLGEAKGVTIKGGYALNYVDRPVGNYTLLQGKLTVGKGSLVTDRLTVK